MFRRQAVTCRQCGSLKVTHLGRIPPASTFAGRPLSTVWDGGHLYECKLCHLGFRHPVRTEREYEQLYAQGSETVWIPSPARIDQELVLRAILSRFSGGSILDVGCFDGSFVSRFGEEFKKFGVEGSLAATRTARLRGVEIIGTHFSEITRHSGSFDVICAIDVIEHVLDPKAFLLNLAERLSSGGMLVVSTGDLDSDAWRKATGRYWYCHYPEHLSFISERWVRAAIADTSLFLKDVQRFAYLDLDRRQIESERSLFSRRVRVSNLKTMAVSLLPGRLGEVAPRTVFGQPGLFVDHLLIVLTKTDDVPRW